MNPHKLLFLLALLTIASCKQDVFPEVEQSSQELVVIAEIEEGIVPTIIVSTTFEVNSAPFPLDDATTFLTIGDPETPTGESYKPREFRGDDGDTMKYFFPGGSLFVPKQGVNYTLDLEAVDTDLPPLIGETTMPYSGGFQNLNPVAVSSQNTQFTEFEAVIGLTAPPDPSTFYHVIPYLIANDGSFIYPEVQTISEGLNAAFVLSHRYGMLVDYSKLDDANPLLSLSLRTITPINVDQLNDSNMYYKLCTVTEDYYRYHRTVSRIYETDKSPFTLPVEIYSQFENGYGIFAAFSAITESVEIQ